MKHKAKDVISSFPKGQETSRIIVLADGRQDAPLSTPVRVLRDLLNRVAGPALVTPPRSIKYRGGVGREYVYWQGRKLNVAGLAALLEHLGIAFFDDERGRPIKPSQQLLRRFLALAVSYQWFIPEDRNLEVDGVWCGRAFMARQSDELYPWLCKKGPPRRDGPGR